MDIKVKSKIQELISNNASKHMSDFHVEEVDIYSLIEDINKNFKIQPLSDISFGDDVIDIFDKCQKRVNGRLKSKELNKNKFLKELSLNFNFELI